MNKLSHEYRLCVCSLCLSVLSGVRIPHIKTSLEEVLSEGIHRVVRLLNANVLESFSQERDQVVLEVHADVLRVGV